MTNGYFIEPGNILHKDLKLFYIVVGMQGRIFVRHTNNPSESFFSPSAKSSIKDYTYNSIPDQPALSGEGEEGSPFPLSAKNNN
jgi:hypothetical protein